MNQDWVAKAALYELLSLGFRFTERQLADALVSGDYADALLEACDALGLEDDRARIAALLDEYTGRDSEEVFREVRREYTRLFVGGEDTLVSPYEGVREAVKMGAKPLLFVSAGAMAMERFAKACGLDRPEGTNEPLDHIATELELLEYLCLDRAGLVNADRNVVPKGAYESLYEDHFASFALEFAEDVIRETRCSLYKAGALTLRQLPDFAL